MTNPPTPLILTIDIGSSSTRVILFDAKGKPISGCSAQLANHMQTTQDGGAIFDMAAIERGVVESIDQVLQKADSLANQIGGVAIATVATNMLGVDANGIPVTPVYTYADTRSRDVADMLRQQLGKVGQTHIHDRTGCLIHTSYQPAQLSWLAEAHPETFAKVAYWISIGEYLSWRFLGKRQVSYSVAAWTGLLNRRHLCWDQETLSLLPINEEQLSPLVDLNCPLVGLTDGWATRWPALAQVPWFPAIGDGAAANVGSGCGALPEPNSPLAIALTIGTTGAMRVAVDATSLAELPMPDGLWLYRIDQQRGLLGGATTEGGNLYAWLRKSLSFPDGLSIEKELQQRQPTQHGLTVLPFVAGERAPGWQDDARASLLGFTLHTQPIDILQASLEGIAYRFALIHKQILGAVSSKDRGKTKSIPSTIVASGGAILSSPAWLQIMADTLYQPVTALEEHEITARGLAILALVELGVISDPSDCPPRLGATYQPDPQRSQLHARAIKRQHDFYQRLIGMV
ncbi:MAG: gluconokinase [Chloroflexota bacterium]